MSGITYVDHDSGATFVHGHVHLRQSDRCLTGTCTANVTTYVAGFLFDPDMTRVALVRKQKPAWQAGRLNGIGGKIEPGESALDAMRREFFEEAGLSAEIEFWHHFATVEGEWGSVAFFRATGPVDIVRTMETEPIEVHDLADLPWGECLPNLSWLIPLARYTHDTYATITAIEENAA